MFYIIVAIVFVLYIKMISILKRNGEKADYFINNPIYFVRFWRLIMNEKEVSTKIKYHLLFWSIVALTIILPITFLMTD